MICLCRLGYLLPIPSHLHKSNTHTATHTHIKASKQWKPPTFNNIFTVATNNIRAEHRAPLCQCVGQHALQGSEGPNKPGEGLQVSFFALNFLGFLGCGQRSLWGARGCVSLREGEGSIDIKEFFHSLRPFTGFQGAAEEKVSSGSSISSVYFGS